MTVPDIVGGFFDRIHVYFVVSMAQEFFLFWNMVPTQPTGQGLLANWLQYFGQSCAGQLIRLLDSQDQGHLGIRGH